MLSPLSKPWSSLLYLCKKKTTHLVRQSPSKPYIRVRTHERLNNYLEAKLPVKHGDRTKFLFV
jgi:hypothetical protein